MHTLFKLASLSALALTLGACSTKYLLTSKFVVNAQAEEPPEIVETPAYREGYKKIYSVAVRAPDSCSDQTSATATGDASARGTILKTQCGVEMAELERALAKKGYRVISWKVLARELAVTADGKSAAAVAAALGAEVMFQINSLEKSAKSLGKDARWERNYFLSNERGERLGEQLFDEPTRKYLRDNYLESKERAVEATGLRRPSVTLDANAVHVATGESIWYYQWTHAVYSGDLPGSEVLVQCKKQGRECVPIKAERKELKSNTETRSSGDSDAVSVGERPEDKLAADHAKLLSKVINSFVESFSKGHMVMQPVTAPLPVAQPVTVPSPPITSGAPGTPPVIVMP